MTTDEKQKIRDLRCEGVGYKTISRTLNVSAEAVRSFCRREGLTGYSRQNINNHCWSCGKPVEQDPNRKQKKFCSDTCRSKWWNRHGNQINKKKYHTRICPCCRNEFEVYSTSPKQYCSHACYIKYRFGGGDYEK